MASDPVTLVRWRRADTDPPEVHFDASEAMSVLRVRSDGIVVLAYYVEDDGWYPIYNGTERLDDLTDDWAHPPQPPGDDALTVGNLRRIEGILVNLRADPRNEHLWPEYDAIAVRLRAALDAIG